MADLIARGLGKKANDDLVTVNTELATKASQTDLDTVETAVTTINTEITNARGTGANLKERLDTVDTTLAQKATKEELQNIGDASPKGTYATLTDLQTAYPTGTTGIYVVTADGNWYYWNGSAWTSGGIYQSAGIENITPEQTNFINKNINKNRFNKAGIILNYLYNSSGNLASTDPSYKYGALLIKDIEGITNLTFSSPDIISDSAKLYSACFFDVNDNFISELIVQKFIKVSNPFTIAIPANAYSAGLSIASYGYAADKKYMVEEGTVATTYEDYLPPYYTFADNIITGSVVKSEVQIKLPPTIPALVGKEMNIYFDNVILCDNLKDYKIDVTCTIGKHQNERWTVVPDIEGTYPLSIGLYKNGETITSASTSVVVKSATVGNGITRKALFIGDSTTDAGTYTGELVNGLFGSDVMNLELLGTRGTSPNLHEGRAGWRASNYLNDASVSGVVNAFYNDGFDFSYYMAQQGYTSVDVVGINLGINDVFSYSDDESLLTEITNVLNRFDTMLNSVKSYNANTKVAFLITIPPSQHQDAFGNNYGNGQSQWRYRRNNFLFVEKLIDKYKGREGEGIYLVPVNVNLDTENNMLTETVQVNSRNTKTVVRQSNGVHPDPMGYKQMSDVIYYWLKSLES